jgi:hypothetical protein
VPFPNESCVCIDCREENNPCELNASPGHAQLESTGNPRALFVRSLWCIWQMAAWCDLNQLLSSVISILSPEVLARLNTNISAEALLPFPLTSSVLFGEKLHFQVSHCTLPRRVIEFQLSNRLASLFDIWRKQRNCSFVSQDIQDLVEAESQRDNESCICNGLDSLLTRNVNMLILSQL